MKRGIRILLLNSLLCLALSACQSDRVYAHFEDIPAMGWSKDSVYSFDYHIADTAASYQVLIYLRHTEMYPYQNMWLFVGDGAQQDTIEFYLANDRGVWLGNGKSGMIEMPVLYEECRRFDHAGTYCITLQQGMREECLRGVANVGIEVVRTSDEYAN